MSIEIEPTEHPMAKRLLAVVPEVHHRTGELLIEAATVIEDQARALKAKDEALRRIHDGVNEHPAHVHHMSRTAIQAACYTALRAGGA